MMLMTNPKKPILLSKKIDPTLQILGEATGILKLEKKYAQILPRILKKFIQQKNEFVEYEESYGALMKKVTIGYETIGHFFWSEMDFEEDLEKIRTHIKVR